MLSETTQEKVQRLNRERPDLIPLLRRCLAHEGNDPHENPDDLAELARRGLLIQVEAAM